MIIYNVTVKVDHSAAADWLQWMKEEHIPALMTTDLFLNARLCRIMEQDETDGITYTAQYLMPSQEHYEAYLTNHAAKMRQDGIDKFGDKFVAFRTVMQLEHQTA